MPAGSCANRRPEPAGSTTGQQRTWPAGPDLRWIPTTDDDRPSCRNRVGRGTGWPVLGDEPKGGEVLDELAVDAGLELEVEVFDRLVVIDLRQSGGVWAEL